MGITSFLEQLRKVWKERLGIWLLGFLELGQVGQEWFLGKLEQQ